MCRRRSRPETATSLYFSRQLECLSKVRGAIGGGRPPPPPSPSESATAVNCFYSTFSDDASCTGVVQEPARQVAQEGAKSGNAEERLRRPVQRLHAAVRQRPLSRLQLHVRRRRRLQRCCLGLQADQSARVQDVSVESESGCGGVGRTSASFDGAVTATDVLRTDLQHVRCVATRQFVVLTMFPLMRGSSRGYLRFYKYFCRRNAAVFLVVLRKVAQGLRFDCGQYGSFTIIAMYLRFPAIVKVADLWKTAT